jgi:hypothetical protein
LSLIFNCPKNGEGYTVSPIAFLPQETKPTKKAVYNAFAELGKSYAYIYHKYEDAAKGYYVDIGKFLSLFHYGHTDYGYEYSVAQNKTLLINLILTISSSLSIEIFNEVLEMLDKDWTANKRYWTTDEIQATIEWVANSNLSNTWCIAQLEKIDDYVFMSGYLDSRIERGITQIRLWSKLGKIDKGEALLAHLMNISFDIRGEKDYQLDYIVGWMNMFEFNMADEVDYYLKRMNSLRDKVNSPSHTPSKDVLSLSFKYGNGFEVFKYLLFEGLVSFTDSLELVLTYFLSSIPEHSTLVTQLFTKILLAYDNHHYSRHDFIDVLLRSKDISTTELKKLVTEIITYSISEYKEHYLFEIQEYALSNGIKPALIGIDSIIVKPERYTKTERDTIDFEDEKLTYAQLIERINTIKDLQEIRAKTTYFSGFSWGDVYTKIFKKATDDEILEFVEKSNPDSKDLAGIAEVLINIDRKDIAKQLLYKAIRKGEKYGWVTFIDGGSKILPFELLNKIEKKEVFQNEALIDFSNSIPAFDIQSTEVLIKDVPKIWNYFSDDVNYNLLYKELENFRNELLKTQKIDALAPSINGSLKDEAFLVSLLFFLVTFPSDFNYALYKILFDEYETSTSIIKELLEQLYKKGFFLKYIKLLTIINIKENVIVAEQKGNITLLLNNKRYDISKLAYQLLESIGTNPDEYIIKATKELPLVYNMEFNRKPSLVGSEDLELDHIDKKGFLKETADPLVYVKLYLTEIMILSDETGIPVLNIAHRVMLLGTNLGFPDWCNSLEEEEIRRIYKGRFDLEISYKRPRNQLVWDGLMQVIKELFELDLIDSTLADMLTDEFDKKSCLIETNPKPDFVASILEGKSGYAPSAREDWAKQITEEYLVKVLGFKVSEDFCILAEHSTLVGMGWGQTEEIRQSFIGLTPEIDMGPARQLIFNMTSQHSIDDYISLKDTGIVLYNGLFTVNKKRNWLAINPLLCKDLGLVYNGNEDNFRWDDINGNKVIESIYWQINSTDNSSKNHNSETAYGWYIVLYESGYQMFKKLLKDEVLYHHRKVSRHMRFSQEKYETDIKEDFHVAKSEKIIL